MENTQLVDGSGAEKIGFFQKLPTEMIAKILSNLRTNELNAMADVCQYWKQVVDNVIGRKVFIGHICEFIPDFLDFGRDSVLHLELEDLPSYGIQTCFVGQLVKKEDYQALSAMFKDSRSYLHETNIQVHWQKPSLLRSLHFCDKIDSSYFKALMPWGAQLREFSVHFAALQSLSTSDINLKTIENIKSLGIWGGEKMYADVHRYRAEWNIDNIIENIGHLLTGSFPRIKDVRIECPYDAEKDKEHMQHVMDFINRHKQTLKELVLEYTLTLESDMFIREGLNNEEDHEFLELGWRALKNLQLSSLALAPFCLFRSSERIMWEDFISSQKELSHLSFLGVFCTERMLKTIIYSNYMTITSICILRMTLYSYLGYHELNCSMFKECRRLKSLVLKGWTLTLSRSGLTHLDQLPKSMEEVELGELGIASVDVNHILKDFPVLKRVDLRYIGSKGQMGVPVDLVKQVIQDRKIPYVLFQKCINGKLPAEGIHNGAPHGASIKEMSKGYVCMKLSSEGYYIPSAPPSSSRY